MDAVDVDDSGHRGSRERAGYRRSAGSPRGEARREELLERVTDDLAVHMPFPDGTWLTQWRDLDRTCEEFARFSPRDAASFRQLGAVLGVSIFVAILATSAPAHAVTAYHRAWWVFAALSVASGAVVVIPRLRRST